MLERKPHSLPKEGHHPKLDKEIGGEILASVESIAKPSDLNGARI